jgi:hypothetical protein
VHRLQNLSLQSADKVVARRDAIIDAKIDDEIVALSIEHGTCYGMNPVGTRIWTLLASPIRICDLCAVLLAEYRVDPEVCERQVLDLLEELRAEGLIKTIEEK